MHSIIRYQLALCSAVPHILHPCKNPARRIFTLYKLQEEEKHLDSIVSFGPAPAALVGELNVTVPLLYVAQTQTDNSLGLV